jgi:hypothetical protein
MNRIGRGLSVAVTLLCAAFALWIASVRMSDPGMGITPAAAAPAEKNGESGEPPSNEILDFQQLD